MHCVMCFASLLLRVVSDRIEIRIIDFPFLLPLLMLLLLLVLLFHSRLLVSLYCEYNDDHNHNSSAGIVDDATRTRRGGMEHFLIMIFHIQTMGPVGFIFMKQ